MAVLAAAVLCVAAPGRGEVYEFGNEGVAATAGDWTGRRYEGQCEWPRGAGSARFSMLRQLLSSDEAATVRGLLPTELDADRDSVDGMSTYEYYLERNGSYGTGVGGMKWKPDADEATRRAREPVRAALSAVLRPVMDNRITPYVNAEYAESCQGLCVPCFSLVRRYRDGERTSHRTHFDIQALVTVVVSLSDYGSEYEGGIFVGTGQKHWYLPLQRGDAVAHQSDLLHGVKVLDGERWSWIMWYQNSLTCDADPTEWFRGRAEAGDAVAQFIHAHRAHMSTRALDAGADRIHWLKRSADAGFPRAQNEVGHAFKTGSGVRRDLAQAEEWYRKAADAGEPEGLYNLGQMLREKGDVGGAVRLFKEAAAVGSPEAMFDLGVASAKGSGVPADRAEAVRWFKASADAGFEGSADALYASHQLLGPADPEAPELLRRAAVAGHEPAVVAYVRSLQQEAGAAAAEGWLQEQARRGAPAAQSVYGRMLVAGDGVEQDATRGEKLLRAAAVSDQAAEEALRELLRSKQRKGRRRRGHSGEL